MLLSRLRRYMMREGRQSEATHSGTHDSIVVYPGLILGHHNQHQVHQEYVIFDREQAYPAYVVQYEL